MSFGIKQNVLFSLFIIVVISLAPINSSAESSSKIVELTDEARIDLLLQGLQSTLNNPDEISVANLIGITPSLDKSNIEYLVQYFSSSKQILKSGNGFQLNQKLWINDSKIIFSGNFATVNTKLQFEIDRFRYSKDMTLIFEKYRHYWIVTNLDNILTDINSFIDIKRMNVSEIALKETFTPLEKKTNFTPDKTSEYLLIPKNIYSDHERFNSTTSYQEFNGDIFSRPHGIMACHFEGFVSESKDYLFISDPNWNRVIASVYFPDIDLSMITSYGKYGSDDSTFSNPRGIDFYFYSGWKFVIADKYNKRAIVYSLSYNDMLTYQTSYYIDGYVEDVAAALFPSNKSEIAILDQTNCEVIIKGIYPIYERSFFSKGSGYGQVLNPKSICYGKSIYTNEHNDILYIADAGNNNRAHVKSCVNCFFKQRVFRFDFSLLS